MDSHSQASNSQPVLEYTGERMVPELTEFDTFWEHIYRYRFACQFVAGRRVLDIACGEGYGAHALSRAGSSNVIGVDISAEACQHAHLKYGLDARRGNAIDIPLPSGSVDVVVSFETIEHISEPGRFLAECRRVLASKGMLVISTPNKAVYAESREANPFHCHEMTEEEFVQALGAQFRSIKIYSQRPKAVAWWSPRVLATQRPWARHIPGYYRLRKAFMPRIATDCLDSRIRSSAVELVLTKDSFLTGLMNPFAVRPRSSAAQERPFYFVAIAQL